MWSADVLVEIKAINKTHIDDLNVSGVFDEDNEASNSSSACTGPKSSSIIEQSTTTTNLSNITDPLNDNQQSTIKMNHKLCAINKERGRPRATTVNRVIGLKSKTTSKDLPVTSQLSSISDESEQQQPSIVKIKKRKITSTSTAKSKKARLTIKLRDNIACLLDFILISPDNTERIINKEDLIDEQHLQVTGDLPEHIIELYNAIKLKYDIHQFFTDEGLAQLKALFKNNF